MQQLCLRGGKKEKKKHKSQKNKNSKFQNPKKIKKIQVLILAGFCSFEAFLSEKVKENYQPSLYWVDKGGKEKLKLYQMLIETRADEEHISPSFLGPDVTLYLHSFQFEFDKI